MVQSRTGAPGLPAEQRLLLCSSGAEGPVGPPVAAAGPWDGAGSSAPLPVACWVAVGLLGERYWVGWRGSPVTLPMDAGGGAMSLPVPGSCPRSSPPRGGLARSFPASFLVKFL